MPEWEAPAKVNLSLLVRPLDATGYHPIRSLVQTLEWCDRLCIEVADGEDRLDVREADLPEGPENLVWVAAERLAEAAGRPRPRLDIVLHKLVAVAAGLGGGSSDAAAVLAALADLMGVDPRLLPGVAAEVGADVPLFLVGGTCLIEGYGERVVPHRLALERVGFAVVVPPFELPTAAVYRAWDRLDAPEGPALGGRDLPPVLRSEGPLRNDLYPAAVSLRPELAEWRSELAALWGTAVAMTGSGPALFGIFPTVEEAADAVSAVPGEARAVAAAAPRALGVGPAGR